MNTLLLSVFSILGLVSASPEKTPAIEWMSWEEMVVAQEEEPRKVVVDIYTDWCGWCKKMDKEVFGHETITAIINEHFYAVKLDAEQKEDITFQDYTFKFVPNGRRGYHELAASLLDGKMSYPTIIYLDEGIQIITRVPGYQDVKSEEVILQYVAQEAYMTTEWATFQANYQSGEQ